MKAHDKEHMKMAILKHEETFKQQVYELHRLYQVQKMLMKGVEHNKPKSQNQQRLNCNSEINLNRIKGNPRDFHEKLQPRFNLDHPVEDYIKELNGDKELEIEDESEIQLTLGPTRYNTKKKTETSDSGLSFSSSSTGSSHIIKATHHGPHHNQENVAWGLTMVTADSNSGYHSTKMNGYCVQDQPNRGRLKQPPWLLQALSLNMS